MVPWSRLLCLAALYVLSFQATAQTDYTPISSPEGGAVSKILQAGNGDLYLLSKAGTLYRSSTLGDSWTELPYPGAVFKDFTIANGNIVLIDNQNVYLSTNQGQTFSQEFYFASTWLNYIRTLPNNKLVLVGQGFGTQNFPLYISSDFGQNWTTNNSNILSSFSGFSFQSVYVSPDGKIIVPTFFGEIASSDEGQTFQVVHTYSYQLPVMAFDNSSIYSMTFEELIRSDDHAQTWTDIRSDLPTAYFGGFIAITLSQKLVWINIWSKTQQVWTSDNKGAAWVSQGTLPVLGELFNDLVSYNNRLFLLGPSGVYASDDYGQTWSKKNTGLNCPSYQDIALIKSKLVLAADPAVYTKKLDDVNWLETRFTRDDFNFNLASFLKGVMAYGSKNFMLFGSQGWDYRSSVDSDSWTPIVANDGSGASNNYPNFADNDTLYAAPLMVLRRLIPDSLKWRRIHPDWEANSMGIMAMTKTKNHRLISYFNTNGGQYLLKTTKDFQIISQTPLSIPLELKSIGDVVLLRGYGSIYRSTDEGSSWTPSTSATENAYRMFTDKQGRLLVGMGGKFKVSLDTGKTWKSYRIDDNVGHIVSGIATDSLGFAYLAVNNVGVLKTNFSVDGIVQQITFQSIGTKKFNDQPFQLIASASSNLPVTFTSSNPSIASVAGNTVTIHAAGSVYITAFQAGDNYYGRATTKQLLTIGKADQQITFQTFAAKTLGDQPFTLTASATSNLPVTFSSSNPAIAKVTGNTVTILTAGSVDITASQAGNTNFNAAAGVTQPLTINPPIVPPTSPSDYTAMGNIEGGPISKILQASNGDLYLLSRGGTLYRSTTFGDSWTELPYPGAIFKDFTLANGNIVLIDDQNVYLSANQGQTFSQEFYFASTQLNQIRTLPNNKVILAGQGIGNQNYWLYISSDYGQNWTTNNSNIFSSFNGLYFQNLYVSPYGEIIVPSYMGVMVSIDEGVTFTVKRTYTYQYPQIVYEGPRVYSLTFQEFVRSDDGMQTWTNVNNGLPPDFFGGFIASPSANKVIWVNPWLLSHQVWRSLDAGTTWQQHGELPVLGEYFTDLISYNNRLFLLGTSGIYASDDDGLTWSKKNSGLHCGNYQDILLKKSQLVVVADPSVYRKNLDQTNWTESRPFNNWDSPIVNNSMGLKGVVPYSSNDYIVFGSLMADFKGSVDNNTWTSIVANDAGGGGSLLSTVTKHDTLYASIQFFPSIRRLMPDSTNWGKVKRDWLTWTNPNPIVVYSMTESKNNHRLVSYGKSSGQFLARTTKDFDLISETPFSAPAEMKEIGGVVFARAYNGIMMSTDDGNSWTYSTSIEDGNSRLFTDKQGRLLMGLKGKFKVSLDTGKTWTTYVVDNFVSHLVAGISTDSLGFAYLAVNEVGILKTQFSVDGPKQKIIFDPIATKTFGDQPFQANVYSTSGLPVSLTSSDPSIASVSGSTITIHAAGSVVITAKQPGNIDINAAADVTQTLVIHKADQQITFQSLATKTFGDQPFTLTATSTSNLTVTFASSDPSVAKITGNTVTILKGGAVDITASQVGNTNFNGAAEVKRTLTINKADQQIAFQALTAKTFGDQPFLLTASSTSNLPVTFSSSDPSVAKITDNTITMLKVGSVDITASQAGDANFNGAADVKRTLTINKADQQITFQSLTAKTFGDQPFTLTATSTSNLPVTFVSSDPSVAKITDNTVTMLKAGSVDITASQAGDANFNAAADVKQTLVINKADQQIAFQTLAAKTFGDQPFTLTASSTSNLSVTFSSSDTSIVKITSNTVTIVKGGSVDITASQAGNANFNAATDVKQTLTINKADQQITFQALTAKTFGDLPFPLTASATSNLPVTFSSSDITVAKITGNTVTILSAGSVDITASQEGNTNFNSTTRKQTLLIAKADQTIQFTVSSKTQGDANFALHAKASSALPVIFNSANSAIISVIDSMAVIKSPGAISITASQQGNIDFMSSTKTVSFCVYPQKPVVSSEKNLVNFPLLSSSSAVGNQWYLNGAKIAGATADSFKPMQAGSYAVKVTVDTCSSKLSDPIEIKVVTEILPTDFDVKLSPNPVTTELNLVFPDNAVEQTRTVEVMDLQGRVLSSVTGTTNEFTMDVSSLSPSLYILRATHAGQTKIFKLVKK